MDAAAWSLVGVTTITLIFGAIGYLLSRKDSQQESFIKDLYEKFQKGSDKTTALELDIAKNFHPKAEIQELFRQQKMHMDERFDRLERAMGIDRRGIDQ